MTGGLIDEKNGGFRVGREFVDKMFTLKKLGEKALEKKRSGREFHGSGEGV